MLDADQKKMAEELLFSEKRDESFAKQLFKGDFDASLAFPFPVPSQEEKEEVDRYVAKLKAFSDEKIDPVAIDRTSSIPSEVIQGLGELGLLSLTIPKEYGGLGMSQYAYCRAMETIAARCASTALFINAHQSVGLKALVLFGTPEQRLKWLPMLSKGRFLAAFSLTEPHAGSDAAGIETEARFDPAKQMYLINGQKQWTTNGSIAKLLTVMAKTPVETEKGIENKITAFIVTPDMPGFKVTAKALDKVGMRGSTTSNLAFENLEVPKENILGPKGGGLKVCLTVLDYGRTTFGATCTGAAKELLKLASRHAVERYQFKRPLAAFPLVKEKLARMEALIYAMEATTYLTAGLIDRGREDVMIESAILKVFNSEALWSITYETMQIYGGRSFFTDAPLERMMRDARLNMVGEGSNEVLRVFIAAVGLRDVGLELKNLKEGLKKSWGNKKLWEAALRIGGHYIKAPKVLVDSLPLKSEATALGDAIRSFAWHNFKALAKYGEGIVDQQLVLNRLAEAAISLYTATAVIGRMDSSLKKGHLPMEELDVGKYYCHLAFRKLRQNLEQLFDPLDEQTERLSDHLTRIK